MNLKNEKVYENIFILFLFISLITFLYFEMNFGKQEGPLNVGINSTEFRYFICSQVQVVPTWMYENGTIWNMGYQVFEEDPIIVIDFLISNKIYFIHSSQCGYCNKQIQDFGDSFIKYKESGFTINCFEVMNNLK
jgi:hypothetical protein